MLSGNTEVTTSWRKAVPRNQQAPMVWGGFREKLSMESDQSRLLVMPELLKV